MTHNRSVELSQQIEETKVPAPPASRRRRSVKEFLKIAVPVITLAITAIVVLWYFFGFQLWYLLIIAVTWYVLYPPYFRWSRNHIAASPDEGVISIEDHAHPFILFFIMGSSPDQVPLDDVNFDTPTRSLLDRYVFNCCTLNAGDKTIKGVRHIEELIAIKKYQESIKKQALDVGKQQLEVAMATLETLESIADEFESSNEVQRDILQTLRSMESLLRSARNDRMIDSPTMAFHYPGESEKSEERDDSSDQ